MRYLKGLTAVSLLLAATLPAAAQRAAPRGSDYGYTDRDYVRAPGAYCRPLCSTDTSPCDPMEFKRADGRCAGVNPGAVR